ncbi:hypothetical protein [Xanthomonas phaseoli]|uniref:hypothetical protein n=1 Tax=Xanthomonas phaseoli TaxID=1985254 RepID=UPI00069CA786|nr:hypothetical protein [Xanthomonas phaseoli]
MSEVIAAIVGALIVWLSTSFNEKAKRAEEKRANAAHLGVVVLTLIEKFISGCAAVAGDNGTVHGSPAGRFDNGEEYYVPQTEIPTIDFTDIKVEWRSISPALMYSIHRIPLERAEALSVIEHVADNDFPPYDEYIVARQEKFAELGMAVIQIAEQLRTEAGLPPKPERPWSSEQYLLERLTELRQAQVEREARSLPFYSRDEAASPVAVPIQGGDANSQS